MYYVFFFCKQKTEYDMRISDWSSDVCSSDPDKPVRLFDGRGLYLEATPTGRRYWRLKYRYAGKEKRLALGVYPEVTLAEARTYRDDARRQLREGREERKSGVEEKRWAVRVDTRGPTITKHTKQTQHST